jgi:predicted metal-dependent hydrolase
MSKSILFLEKPQIKVAVRKVRNSTRLSLRVSSINESVTLTAPVNTNQDVLLKFLESKENWLKENLLKISNKKVHVDIGSLIPILALKSILKFAQSPLM